MEHYPEDDLRRVKELLTHASEFIAYFEHAETKMMEWRSEMDGHSFKMKELAQDLTHKLSSLNELLKETGIQELRDATQKAIEQGAHNQQSMDKSYAHIKENIQQQQETLRSLTLNCLDKIEKKTLEATDMISNHLSKYDAQHFHRIASESCDHIDQVAQNAVHKSAHLLKLFHVKMGLFAVFTTVISSFIFALYLSDEFPWEMHSQARNEREAGKVLLQAWHYLSQEEKTKILSENGLGHR